MSSTSCCCCCLYSPWRKFKSCTACFMYIIFITVCMFCNLCHMNDLVSLYAGLQPTDWKSSSGAACLNQYGYIWHLLTTCVSFSHVAMSQISAASGYYRWITSHFCANKINIRHIIWSQTYKFHLFPHHASRSPSLRGTDIVERLVGA